MKWRKEGRDGYALAGEVIASGRRIDQMWIVIHPLVRRRRDDFNS